ncbi:MAG: spore maturation protein [Chitinophagia bacterium]|nr:spore maturation protein [Chitinophagia bacterium]
MLVKIFPDVPANHPALGYMTLNFAANFLGLDSAATPFGLKAMASLQELNKDKDTASNPQLMFMCLHSAGLTLLPTSIIGYRAAQNAHNPADVMLPCIITSFAGTLAAMLLVGIRQRISFRSAALLLSLAGISGLIAGLLFYIGRLDLAGKNHFTGNLSNIILLGIILGILLFSWLHEKTFSNKGINIYASFVNGATDGLNTGIKVLPYIMGMLAAISLFRNSGLFEIASGAVGRVFLAAHLNSDIVNALPVALLRPFSSGGSRGFMIDAMKMYGPDSFTGRLSCVFQCSAETTFYVIAVYFGSINVKNTRYALSAMLLTDLICVITAVAICSIFF